MLEVSGLCKTFSGKPALSHVSFKIQPGEIYGLLGHNGAGKSTALGIILGMVAADAGDVTIGGISVRQHRSAALRKVGAIFETPSFYDYLSGWENLRLLMGYSGGFDPAASRATVELVGLTKRIHSKVRTYSHGMRQRLALAQSLLPEPALLLLDEPTDGLDPEGIKWFREFILTLRQERGMTVLFNSHLLAEVELMCDRVAILREGRQVFEGPIGGLQDEAQTFEVELEPWAGVAPLVLACGGEILSPNRLRLPHGVDPALLVESLVRGGIRVRAFAPIRRSLEELYMEILHDAPSPN
jgi:ABC-2 type transport system ATP-binding protein